MDIATLVQLLGPTLAIAIGVAITAIVQVRTQGNEIKSIKEKQGEFSNVGIDMAKLSEKLAARLLYDAKNFERNDLDHDRLKKMIDDFRKDAIERLRRLNGDP